MVFSRDAVIRIVNRYGGNKEAAREAILSWHDGVSERDLDALLDSISDGEIPIQITGDNPYLWNTDEAWQEFDEDDVNDELTAKLAKPYLEGRVNIETMPSTIKVDSYERQTKKEQRIIKIAQDIWDLREKGFNSEYIKERHQYEVNKILGELYNSSYVAGKDYVAKALKMFLPVDKRTDAISMKKDSDGMIALFWFVFLGIPASTRVLPAANAFISDMIVKAFNRGKIQATRQSNSPDVQMITRELYESLPRKDLTPETDEHYRELLEKYRKKDQPSPSDTIETIIQDLPRRGPGEGAMPDTNVDKELMFVSRRDEKVCPICRALDGTVYDANDPDMPKITEDTHPNCRCTYVLLKNGRAVRAKAVSASGESVLDGHRGVWRTSKTGKKYFIREGESPAQGLKRAYGDLFEKGEKIPAVRKEKTKPTDISLDREDIMKFVEEKFELEDLKRKMKPMEKMVFWATSESRGQEMFVKERKRRLKERAKIEFGDDGKKTYNFLDKNGKLDMDKIKKETEFDITPIKIRTKMQNKIASKVVEALSKNFTPEWINTSSHSDTGKTKIVIYGPTLPDGEDGIGQYTPDIAEFPEYAAFGEGSINFSKYEKPGTISISLNNLIPGSFEHESVQDNIDYTLSHELGHKHFYQRNQRANRYRMISDVLQELIDEEFQPITTYSNEYHKEVLRFNAPTIPKFLKEYKETLDQAIPLWDMYHKDVEEHGEDSTQAFTSYQIADAVIRDWSKKKSPYRHVLMQIGMLATERHAELTAMYLKENSIKGPRMYDMASFINTLDKYKNIIDWNPIEMQREYREGVKDLVSKAIPSDLPTYTQYRIDERGLSIIMSRTKPEGEEILDRVFYYNATVPAIKASLIEQIRGLRASSMFRPNPGEMPDDQGFYWRTVRGRKIPFREGRPYQSQLKQGLKRGGVEKIAPVQRDKGEDPIKDYKYTPHGEGRSAQMKEIGMFNESRLERIGRMQEQYKDLDPSIASVVGDEIEFNVEELLARDIPIDVTDGGRNIPGFGSEAILAGIQMIDKMNPEYMAPVSNFVFQLSPDDGDDEYLGAYNKDTGQVKINVAAAISGIMQGGNFKKQMKDAITHEIAHAHYFNADPVQRTRWESQILKMAKNNDFKGSLNEYPRDYWDDINENGEMIEAPNPLSETEAVSKLDHYIAYKSEMADALERTGGDVDHPDVHIVEDRYKMRPDFYKMRQRQLEIRKELDQAQLQWAYHEGKIGKKYGGDLARASPEEKEILNRYKKEYNSLFESEKTLNDTIFNDYENNAFYDLVDVERKADRMAGEMFTTTIETYLSEGPDWKFRGWDSVDKALDIAHDLFPSVMQTVDESREMRGHPWRGRPKISDAEYEKIVEDQGGPKADDEKIDPVGREKQRDWSNYDPDTNPIEITEKEGKFQPEPGEPPYFESDGVKYYKRMAGGFTHKIPEGDDLTELWKYIDETNARIEKMEKDRKEKKEGKKKAEENREKALQLKKETEMRKTGYIDTSGITTQALNSATTGGDVRFESVISADILPVWQEVQDDKGFTKRQKDQIAGWLTEVTEDTWDHDDVDKYGMQELRDIFDGHMAGVTRDHIDKMSDYPMFKDIQSMLYESENTANIIQDWDETNAENFFRGTSVNELDSIKNGGWKDYNHDGWASVSSSEDTARDFAHQKGENGIMLVFDGDYLRNNEYVKTPKYGHGAEHTIDTDNPDKDYLSMDFSYERESLIKNTIDWKKMKDSLRIISYARDPKLQKEIKKQYSDLGKLEFYHGEDESLSARAKKENEDVVEKILNHSRTKKMARDHLKHWLFDLSDQEADNMIQETLDRTKPTPIYTQLIKDGKATIGANGVDQKTVLSKPIIQTDAQSKLQNLKARIKRLVAKKKPFKPGRGEKPDAKGYYWRTIRGRRIPIKDGQSLGDAIRQNNKRMGRDPERFPVIQREKKKDSIQIPHRKKWRENNDGEIKKDGKWYLEKSALDNLRVDENITVSMGFGIGWTRDDKGNIVDTPSKNDRAYGHSGEKGYYFEPKIKDIYPVKTAIEVWQNMDESYRGNAKLVIEDSSKADGYFRHDPESGGDKIYVSPVDLVKKPVFSKNPRLEMEYTMTHELAHFHYFNSASYRERFGYELELFKQIYPQNYKPVTTYDRDHKNWIRPKKMTEAEWEGVSEQFVKYMENMIEMSGDLDASKNAITYEDEFHSVHKLHRSAMEKVVNSINAEHGDISDEQYKYRENPDGPEYMRLENRKIKLRRAMDNLYENADRIHSYLMTTAMERHAVTISNYLNPSYTYRMSDIGEYKKSLKEIQKHFPGQWTLIENARKHRRPKLKARIENNRPDRRAYRQYYFDESGIFVGVQTVSEEPEDPIKIIKKKMSKIDSLKARIFALKAKKPFKPGRNEKPDKDGNYWRTIRGRRIPIRSGQTIAEAIKENDDKKMEKMPTVKKINPSWTQKEMEDEYEKGMKELQERMKRDPGWNPNYRKAELEYLKNQIEKGRPDAGKDAEENIKRKNKNLEKLKDQFDNPKDFEAFKERERLEEGRERDEYGIPKPKTDEELSKHDRDEIDLTEDRIENRRNLVKNDKLQLRSILRKKKGDLKYWVKQLFKDQYWLQKRLSTVANIRGEISEHVEIISMHKNPKEYFAKSKKYASKEPVKIKQSQWTTKDGKIDKKKLAKVLPKINISSVFANKHPDRANYIIGMYAALDPRLREWGGQVNISGATTSRLAGFVDPLDSQINLYPNLRQYERLYEPIEDIRRRSHGDEKVRKLLTDDYVEQQVQKYGHSRLGPKLEHTMVHELTHARYYASPNVAKTNRWRIKLLDSIIDKTYKPLTRYEDTYTKLRGMNRADLRLLRDKLIKIQPFYEKFAAENANYKKVSGGRTGLDKLDFQFLDYWRDKAVGRFLSLATERHAEFVSTYLWRGKDKYYGDIGDKEQWDLAVKQYEESFGIEEIDDIRKNMGEIKLYAKLMTGKMWPEVRSFIHYPEDASPIIVTVPIFHDEESLKASGPFKPDPGEVPTDGVYWRTIDGESIPFKEGDDVEKTVAEKSQRNQDSGEKIPAIKKEKAEDDEGWDDDDDSEYDKDEKFDENDYLDTYDIIQEAKSLATDDDEMMGIFLGDSGGVVPLILEEWRERGLSDSQGRQVMLALKNLDQDVDDVEEGIEQIEFMLSIGQVSGSKINELRKWPVFKDIVDALDTAVQMTNEQQDHDFKNAPRFYRGTGEDELKSINAGKWNKYHSGYASISTSKHISDDFMHNTENGVMLIFDGDELRDTGNVEPVHYTFEDEHYDENEYGHLMLDMSVAFEREHYVKTDLDWKNMKSLTILSNLKDPKKQKEFKKNYGHLGKIIFDERALESKSIQNTIDIIIRRLKNIDKITDHILHWRPDLSEAEAHNIIRGRLGHIQEKKSDDDGELAANYEAEKPPIGYTNEIKSSSAIENMTDDERKEASKKRIFDRIKNDFEKFRGNESFSYNIRTGEAYNVKDMGEGKALYASIVNNDPDFQNGHAIYIIGKTNHKEDDDSFYSAFLETLREHRVPLIGKWHSDYYDISYPLQDAGKALTDGHIHRQETILKIMPSGEASFIDVENPTELTGRERNNPNNPIFNNVFGPDHLKNKHLSAANVFQGLKTGIFRQSDLPDEVMDAVKNYIKTVNF